MSPVIPPDAIGAATNRLLGVVGRVGDGAAAVGDRLRPAPPAPGLRAVRDA